MTHDPFVRAWIEIRGDAVRRNLQRIRAAVPEGVSVIPMVKADAYGLGVEGAVEALRPEAPAAWGVALVEEGERLRALGVQDPVVVFAPVAPTVLERALEAELTLSVSDLDLAERLGELAGARGRAAAIQVEVDTGMGRAGLPWDRASEWGPRLQALTAGGSLRWEGCFTHFHSADEGEEGGGPASMEAQAERFRRALEVLGTEPGGPLLRHLGNSAAALRRPALVGGAVRPGIFLYGGSAGAELPAPEPAVALRARVSLVREVAPGTTVGYGATYRATRTERWATLSIGYGDGLPRALSNRGAVLLRGRRAPMVGRISMDMTVVDITDIPGVQPGDVATLLGEDGALRITVEEMAMEAGTINYEILTGFTPRLPRVWTTGGNG
jgi:alanine racemase